MAIKTFIIAEFPAAEGKFEELEATLKASLGDTRKFDGCIALDVFVEQGSSTFSVIEDWESQEHYERYLQWRLESGLADLLEPLLAGGIASFKVRRFGARIKV